MRKRKLKVWNGTLIFTEDNEGNWYRWSKQLHVSVCAYSQKDAVDLLREYGHNNMSLHHFREYWSDCWGKSMDGIEPERGIWVEFERDVPVKLEKGVVKGE